MRVGIGYNKALSVIAMSLCAFTSGCSSMMSSGCTASHHQGGQPLLLRENSVQPPPSNAVQVARYSSVRRVATSAQTTPLLATVQLTFPTSVKTVGEAIQQTLMGTGYTLVPPSQLSPVVTEVMAKPLPVTQRHLGPLRACDALRVLIGAEVFTLIVDPVHRLVNFELTSRFHHYQKTPIHHPSPSEKRTGAE